MKNKRMIITISREFGSGGRIVGENLAEALGIPFYDREIIENAVKESGIDEATFLEEENKTSRGYYFLGALGNALGSQMSVFPGSSPSDQAFTIQLNVMRQMAQEGSCVMVGRCADFILQDFDNVISIYLHAPLKDRLRRIEEEYGIHDEDLEEVTSRIDKQRANYYNYYTNRLWGNSSNYHISLDTSKFGLVGCVSAIKKIVEEHK